MVAPFHRLNKERHSFSLFFDCGLDGTSCFYLWLPPSLLCPMTFELGAKTNLPVCQLLLSGYSVTVTGKNPRWMEGGEKGEGTAMEKRGRRQVGRSSRSREEKNSWRGKEILKK